MKKIAYLSIGSNIESRIDNIYKALLLLSKNDKIKVLTISSFYETEPVGYKDQSWFINCAVKISTVLLPFDLLAELHIIENQLKRKREIQFGPRTIDLDILLYGDEIINTDNLIIPHPRMNERKFVLAPLSEIAKQVKHPINKKTFIFLLKNLNDNSEIKLFNPI